MTPLTLHTGRLAVINRANIDTDVLMPKQYLKCVSRTGYGGWVFDDWRYLDPGDVNTPVQERRPNPGFALNQPCNQGASFLLTGENMGCGSSREHAVWGLRDYGFRVLLAPSYGDIFHANCGNNGVLAISLPESTLNALITLHKNQQGLSLTLDLPAQKLICGEQSWPFTLGQTLKQRLINGVDAIGDALARTDKIRQFEQQHRAQNPWYFSDQKG